MDQMVDVRLYFWEEFASCTLFAFQVRTQKLRGGTDSDALETPPEGYTSNSNKEASRLNVRLKFKAVQRTDTGIVGEASTAKKANTARKQKKRLTCYAPVTMKKMIDSVAEAFLRLPCEYQQQQGFAHIEWHK